MSSDKKKMANLKLKSQFLATFFLILMTISALVLSAKRGTVSKNLELESRHEQQQDAIRPDSCDLSSGKWVLDEASPVYGETECSFMIDDYACEKYGRRDFKFRRWKWQPHECNLPRFNATALLEKLRGKTLIFVGDSLNKNQWISLLCLIESSVSTKSITRRDNLFTLYATEFDATIGFYWSPLLVESNCDNPDTHSIKDRVIRISSIEKHARYWSDADILVFDSFAWWLEPTMTVMWGSFESPYSIKKRVQMPHRRYEMVLETWSQWLEININRTKTRLFFRSLSPLHLFGESWGEPMNCYNVTEPIGKPDYWGVMTDVEMMRASKMAVDRLAGRGLRIEYMNITHLSDLRIDGHPSIYRKFHQPLSEEQMTEPTSYADCAHWCLPGVPDVWNQILYSYVIN